MRARALLLTALLALASGCRALACANGTLFLSLSLSSAAQTADSLDIAISIDHVVAQHQAVSRPNRGSSDSVTIAFSKGYHPGHDIQVTVVALAAGAPVGSGSDEFIAANGCTARALSINPLVGGNGPCDGGCMPQLTALQPTLASAGATLTLEGTFGSSAIVSFPGGVAQPATVLGPHRATVVVPASARSGALSLVTDGQSVGALPWRRTSFAPSLGGFDGEYEQAGGAAQMPHLSAALVGHSSVAIGGSLYVIGGFDGNSAVGSVTRATLNADGTLSPFSPVAGLQLVTPRYQHTSVVVGNALYVIGGLDGNGPLGSVERATLQPDGILSPFVTISATLSAARYSHASVIVGDGLFLVGGLGMNGYLSSIERAPIAPDGSLGAFAPIATALARARAQHSANVVGNWLYVIGGQASDGSALDTVESSAIAPDGTLAPFSTVAGVTLQTARSWHTSFQLSDGLYVIGGSDGTQAVRTIERAIIHNDGTLSAFAFGPTLARPRDRHALAIAGNSLYVIGGEDRGSYLPTLERASLDAGGAIGDFATVGGGINLSLPRNGHFSAVVGSSLYVIGGNINNSSVERAAIDAEGELGNFAAVSGVNLTTPRWLSAGAVIGNFVYVIGGNNGGALGSVERAAISANGALTTSFATVPNLSLHVPRIGPAAVVLGNTLYVLGGFDADLQSFPLASIERATIGADGALGPFSVYAGMTLAAGRLGASVLVSGGFLYVIGGAGGALPTVERSAINPDGSLAGFSFVNSIGLSTVRTQHASALVGGSLYVLGGSGDAGALASVERATLGLSGALSAGFSATTSSMMSARTQLSSIVVGNWIYVIGGSASAGPFTTVERALLP